MSSKEIDAVARIHGRETFRRGEGSYRNYHLHPPPLPLLILLPFLLSLVGTEAYLIALVASALLYIDQNTLGSLHVTASSKVSIKFVRRELVEEYRRNQAVQSEIERELENLENQENIPPPPAYVAPEQPAANPTNRAAPRIVFGTLPILPEEICIHREALPIRPRTPNPGFRYRYNPRDFLAPGQETEGQSGNSSEVTSGYQTPDADLANVE